MKLRAEETKRSRTYLVLGTLENGEECQVVLTVSCQCQVPGSKDAVETNFAAVTETIDRIYKEK